MRDREPEPCEGGGGGAVLFEWALLVYLTRVFQICARSLYCVPREPSFYVAVVRVLFGLGEG